MKIIVCENMRSGITLLKVAFWMVWKYGIIYGATTFWMLFLLKIVIDLLPYPIASHTIMATVRGTYNAVCKILDHVFHHVAFWPLSDYHEFPGRIETCN